MRTWHLHIRGRVQGVGFRPHVWKLARTHALCGTVCNTTDGVHVWFGADEPTARRFAEQVVQQAPPLAQVLDWQLEEAPCSLPEGFHIVASSDAALPDLVLTPDAALCAQCRAELHAPENRRHGYPFITCTQCGPRYSIIEALPYDRPRTTMAPLAMCEACAAEYDDPDTRRYYAQTNSCPQCPVPLFLWEGRPLAWRRDLSVRQQLERVVQWWQQGGIVAVKGIGGYLLTCDAHNAEAVRLLRKRKRRPHKPLALMAPKLEAARRIVQLPSVAMRSMTGAEAPIVIAPITEWARRHLPMEVLAPGLDELGVMLPYAPLFELLLARFGRAIVATSGNLSGSPIVYEDEQAIELLAPLCDALLGYERRIVVPQDDSVMRVGADARPLWLRRSRGLAPALLLSRPVGSAQLLAMGARMKSAFAIQVRGRLYLSQYLGDTESYEAWRSYQHTLAHLQRLLAFEPELILTDRHPDFPATRLGEAMAQQYGIPCQRVPHHEAHFAALLGEHALDGQAEPVLGIVWDGMGLGHDELIRGGEFFLFREGRIEHLGALQPWPHLAGDKMAREARLAAFAIAADLPEVAEQLRPLFCESEWHNYKKLHARSRWYTTSMGRLFDAVGCLLGLPARSSFEGQVPMWLEAMAWRHVRRHGWYEGESLWPEARLPHWPVAPLVARLARLRKQGVAPEALAARFHHALALQAGLAAQRLGLRKVGFSGGVFQNRLLRNWIHRLWGHALELYFHERLPPNDENIAFGQIAWYELMTRQPHHSHSKTSDYVSSYSR